MASNAFTQQAQNDLVQNLENLQVENDILFFCDTLGSLYLKNVLIYVFKSF